ncbi:hypothetical protein DL765_002533 [Monosporascus sp. GIB2]|nr:hypothetical protein DL765_002533 [Monosporascus sp. GIB2]
MGPQSPIGMLLLWVSTAAAWSRTDHWQTTVRSRGSTSPVTSSISVIPTGAATPISSKVSTTLVTEGAVGGFPAKYYTIEVTVTDLFYADTASGLCAQFASCSPTPTLRTSSSITTEYYAPVAISNPVSCTRTSFAYTTAKSIFLPDVSAAIPNFAEQATQSAQALLITTYVSTLSTNLGGQDVTTSICEVYFREGAVTGVDADTRAHSECVDPRIHDCSVALARASHFQVFDPSTSAACQTDQKYPPANIGATGTAGGVTEPTSTSGVSAGFQIKMEWSFGAAGAVGLLGFL